MSISVDTVLAENLVRITVEDNFDHLLQHRFRESYQTIKLKGAAFHVNLSRTPSIDSSGLGMILLLKEFAEKQGGKLVLEKPNEAVTRVLDITCFDQLVPIVR